MKELKAVERIAKLNADNFVLLSQVRTKDILAIAEAFRALEQLKEQYLNNWSKAEKECSSLEMKCVELEQRGEAAEAKVKEFEEEQAEHDQQIATLQGKFDLALAGLRSKTSRCDKAEAKLAELDKQRNPDYFLNRIESCDKWGPEVELRIYESQLDASKSRDDHGGGIIELFTRPAPAINLTEMVPSKLEEKEGDYQSLRDEKRGYNACIDKILRNIEEEK